LGLTIIGGGVIHRYD